MTGDPTEVFPAMPKSFRSPDADDWEARQEIARAADRVIGQARFLVAMNEGEKALAGLRRALVDLDAAVSKADEAKR